MTECKKVNIWVGRPPNHFEAKLAVPLGIGSLLGSGYANDVEMQRLCLDPIDSLTELVDAEIATVNAFHNEFIRHVVEALPLPANARYPRDFWSIVLAPWLLFVIQTCYLNYRLLQKYVARYRDHAVDVHIFSRFPFSRPPASSDALVDILLGENFHAWVIGRYLSAIKPPKWNICQHEQPEETKTPCPRPSPITRTKAQLRKLLNKLRCTSEQIPINWQILFSLLLEFRKVARQPGKGAISVPSTAPRASNAGGLSSDFVATTKMIVDQCLPDWYRQDFPEHFNRVAQKRYRAGYGRIVSSNIYDDESNLTKAMAIESGEVVIGVQHGGGYGTHEVFCLSPASEYLGGPFITWGWREHQSYPVDALPLPSPRLSKLCIGRRTRKHLENDIVFVGGDMSPFKLRIHSKPAGSQWLDYRQQKVAFLHELSGETLAAVLYRGYNSGALEDYAFLQERFPTLRLCRGSYRDFHRRMKSARLCIVDHPITTLHQALAMNIPTVAYWNHNHWNLSSQAAPWFAELESVGIVHRSGEAAGRFVNENFNRVEQWWNTEGVQAVRRRWCHLYARTSDSWVRDWFSAIWRDAQNGN